jgi:predicted nucleic acid-binding protein
MQADFKVVLDACVLANAGVCDLFLRLAEPPRLYLPLWSATILEEVHRTQTTKLKRPYPIALADHWRNEVTRAFPEAEVRGHEKLILVMTNHEKDRHVLATAVRGGASLIVTFNLKDFADHDLEPWEVTASHPQDYLLALHSMNPGVVVAKLAAMAQHQQTDLQDLLLHLGKSVPAFAARLLETIGS